MQPGLQGRKINLPAAKLLGGTSALNAQALVAPSKAGIDAWAKLGNAGWDWSSLSPYYRKFYSLTLPNEATRKHLRLEWIDESVRGDSGPIKASFINTQENAMAKAWIETYDKFHLGTSGDPFTGESIGAYTNMSTVDASTKTRSYSASAYAAPAFNRSNFRLITDAGVQKIHLRKPESGFVADGVEVIINGEKSVVDASIFPTIPRGNIQSSVYTVAEKAADLLKAAA